MFDFGDEVRVVRKNEHFNKVGKIVDINGNALVVDLNGAKFAFEMDDLESVHQPKSLKQANLEHEREHFDMEGETPPNFNNF